MNEYTGNIQHPISIEKNPRIDIFYGRRQDDVAEDVMTLVHQSLPLMQAEETVLVINSLCVHDDLVVAMDRISKQQAAKTLVYSASGKKLREKLEFISTLIVAKNVKMLIVNCFEFAAFGSRQKHALVNWLREMRDAHKLRVVVYSCEQTEPKFGALSQLGYAASSYNRVATWRWEHDYKRECTFKNATEASLEYAESVMEAEAAAPDAVEASKSVAMTLQRRKWQEALQLLGAREMLTSERAHSLKNNDLSPASAHPAIIDREEESFQGYSEVYEEEYEEEYAMAA